MSTKILLVEDNENIRRVLAMCLQQRGFVVEQAHNAFEAVQKLEDETFDVVVSDIKLPGINGLDLSRHIVDNFGGTAIVLMTGDPTARGMQHLDEAGVSCLLIKPFQVRELVNSIRRVLPGKNA